jgi:hypothetical protein
MCRELRRGQEPRHGSGTLARTGYFLSLSFFLVSFLSVSFFGIELTPFPSS